MAHHPSGVYRTAVSMEEQKWYRPLARSHGRTTRSLSVQSVPSYGARISAFASEWLPSRCRRNQIRASSLIFRLRLNNGHGGTVVPRSTERRYDLRDTRTGSDSTP